jgi:chemotaxis protein CheD
VNSIIRIGEIGFGIDTDCLRTFFGSCVAIVLHDPVNRAAALAHVQLPTSTDQPTLELGRYADTAVPELVRQLQQRSRLEISLVAHIVGGADMFPVTQARSVGRLNTAAVKALLLTHRIPILTEDCGGNLARRLVFDVRTGKLQIENIEPPLIVSKPPIVSKPLGMKP